MRIRPGKNIIILGALILFLISTNIVWIKKDKAPPMWDQSHYLFGSEIMYHTLTKEGVIPFVSAFTEINDSKAPLITVLPIPFYLLFGDNYASALYMNLFLILVGGCYLFRLVSLISGEKEALLSVFILNTFPLIFAMSREFLVEYGLMVLVIAWMYYLLRSDGFRDRRCAYALGIVLGLGMLMKVSFPLYIVFPTGYLFLRRIAERERSSSASLFKNVLIVSVVGGLISAVWYFKNLRRVLDFALTSAFSETAKNWGMGEVFSVKTVLNYWTFIVNHGISSYYFLLMIFLAVATLIISALRRSVLAGDRANLYFLSLWFAMPFVVFTFGVNKDYRYAAPFLPAVAVMTGIALGRFSSRKYASITLPVLLLFPLFNYLFISFSSGHVELREKQFILLADHLTYAHPPSKEKWPGERVVDVIYRDAMGTGNDHALTTVLFDHQFLNCTGLNYRSANNGLDLRFDTVDPGSKETMDEAIAKVKEKSDYILTKSGKLGPDSTNVRNIQVESSLSRGELDVRQIAQMQLPDGTSLTVYKNRKQSARIVVGDVLK